MSGGEFAFRFASHAGQVEEYQRWCGQCPHEERVDVFLATQDDLDRSMEHGPLPLRLSPVQQALFEMRDAA